MLEVPAASGGAPAPMALGSAAPPPAPAPAVKVATPFAAGQEWRGSYTCAQGETELFLQIRSVERERVAGVFAFFHDASGASGAFELEGRFDPATGEATLLPGAWLSRPNGYVTVGLVGRVVGDHYSGRIDDPTCGAFSVRRVDDDVDED